MSDSLAAPWTVAHQVPLYMGFPRQEPFPSPGDLSNPGTEPASHALAGRFFTTEPPGKLHTYSDIYLSILKWRRKCVYIYTHICI